MIEMKNDFKDEVRNSILRAAKILADQAGNIVTDVDVNGVSEIYITIRIAGGENTTMDVTKTYGRI